MDTRVNQRLLATKQLGAGEYYQDRKVKEMPGSYYSVGLELEA